MLENLEPKKVFQYFEEICAIPHGSGNVDAISDYLVDFAKRQGLWWKQDALKNVIIIKEASKGKENQPAIMIQGHMDMVAVKEAYADIDMEKDGLKLGIDGDYVYAKDTSLGADDGIALAYGMALLSDESISHPRLELIVTTEEEVGMEGATGIDLSPCVGMQMLNIDSEEEGQFVAACAGGIRVNGKIPVEREAELYGEGKCSKMRIMLTGFTGGHSGTEIGKNSGNANIILGWFLKELSKEVDITIYKIQGGSKDNAIPVESYAVVGNGGAVDGRLWADKVISCCNRLQEEMQKRFAVTDPACRIVLETMEDEEEDNKKENDKKEKNKEEENGEENSKKENLPCGCLKMEDGRKILDFLAKAPNGVQSMCKEPEGLVQTSLNLGMMKLEEDGLQVAFSLRSSVAREKEELKKRVCGLIEEYKGLTTTAGDYPAWEYKKDSPLREKMLEVYEKQYGEKPLVLSLHAGLECGILAAKKPGLDCVSFGPDILDIHTTRERMSISSVNRVWKFLVEVIEKL